MGVVAERTRMRRICLDPLAAARGFLSGFPALHRTRSVSEVLRSDGSLPELTAVEAMPLHQPIERSPG
jgi:hypothetical protein